MALPMAQLQLFVVDWESNLRPCESTIAGHCHYEMQESAPQNWNDLFLAADTADCFCAYLFSKGPKEESGAYKYATKKFLC